MNTYIVGLDASGKSTALAALWFSVVDRSEWCEWFLPNSDRPSDTSYWAELRDRWLRGESLDITVSAFKLEVLKLRLSKKGKFFGLKKLNILIPDIAGEDFQKIYELGRFPKKHTELLTKSDHIVLFVRSDMNDHPILLMAPNKMTQVECSENKGFEWHPREAHPSCKLIAILKGIRRLRDNDMPRITVALSAWDLVQDNLSPREVIKINLPLLYQYLQTNFVFDVVGVSAQGFDYDKGLQLKDGIELDDIKRIIVVDNEIHHDITRVFA